MHGPGWAYLYMASELRLGIATHDVQYLRHVQRLVAPDGDTVVNHAADLQARMQRIKAIVKQAMELLTDENSMKAFGSGNRDGDEESVRVVTSGLVAMYAELLGWASSARSAEVPADWTPVYKAVAQLSDTPIESIRRYSADWDRHAQAQAHALQAGQRDLKGTMRLTISISDEDFANFSAEFEALKAKLAAPSA